MGARWKIHCSSIGIILVLMGCGAALCFEYGQSSSFRAKPRGLMDIFGTVFQQNPHEDHRSWPNMMPSVSQDLDFKHWGLYQKPVQQPDYERHFYNFGEQANDVCSDEGMDYSSLDFSCQEPDNSPCGEADSEYTDQPVDCNDDTYGIRWKGSPPEKANIEIEEMISKGWRSQWSTGGGVSEDKCEEATTPKSIPNFSGLTNVDVHKCFPQGGNNRENGLQSKATGDEYFVLVIKKDHILGDAMKLNKTEVSIDAFIGASLQPPNSVGTAPTDDPSQSHHGSSTQGSSVDNATPIITAPTFTTTSQPRINPTKMTESSTKAPTPTSARMPDEAVAQSPDGPTKISILENPQISSSTTTPAITVQPNYTEIPKSVTPDATSKSGSDGVASQSMDGPTKISLSSNPVMSVDASIPISDSKGLKPNNPIQTVIPSNYPNSPTGTVVPPNSAPDSNPTGPPSIWTTSAKPIVIHTTVPLVNTNKLQGAIYTPDNTPQSLESGSSFVESKPEATIHAPAPATIAAPGNSSTQGTEMYRSSDSNYGGVTPVSKSAETTTTTIVNDSFFERSPRPIPLPAVYKTKSTEEDTAAVFTTKTDLQPNPAIIVNDKPIVAATPKSTNFGTTQPSDTPSTVGETNSIDGNTAVGSTAESETIVNDASPVVARPQPISVGSTGLDDSTQMAGSIKPEDNSAESDLQQATGTNGNDRQGPAEEKPQTGSSDSSHLRGPTSVNTVSNDSEFAVMGSESLVPLVNRSKSSTEHPESSDIHNYQLLTKDEKRPIQNKEKTADSQSTETALTKNVSEKEIIPANKGTAHYETTSSDPTKSQTFTVPINSNGALSVRESTKPVLTQAPKEFENNSSHVTSTVIEPVFTVTTPAFKEEDNSPPAALNFSPTTVGNNTRTNGSYAAVDIVAAVAGSQSESSTSNLNFGVNDVPTTVSTTIPSLVTESNPQFKILETTPLTKNYDVAITALDPISDATVTSPAIPQTGTASGHIQDIGHTIKGLQDLVNKLMSTVNSPSSSNAALSPSGMQKSKSTPGDTVTKPLNPKSEMRETVNASTEINKIPLPKEDTTVDEFQGDLDSTPIVPTNNFSVPPIETTTPSLDPTLDSQSTEWNSRPESKQNDEVSSANAIPSSVYTTPTVLYSQSPMSTLESIATTIRSGDHPSVKNDSPRVVGVTSSETTELPWKPDSTVNGTILASEDPPIADANALPSVAKLLEEVPENLTHSTNKPTTVNDSKISDNDLSLNRYSPAKDVSYKESPSSIRVSDEMPTTTPAFSSQLPDATVNQTNASDSGGPGGPAVRKTNDMTTPSNDGISNEMSTAGEMVSSPSPDLTTPLPHPAPSAIDSNGTQKPANISDAKNSPDISNSSQSTDVHPVTDSTNSLSSSPAYPVTVKEPVESNTGFTIPVTFTESSYDASSFTVPTEETTKSSSRPKSIHKILSFMSWMRGKKSADNATVNAAPELTETAFDPIEEVIETSDTGLPLIDKDILPENLANWFLGFHSAEDEDTSHLSDVNESQSSEVPNASLEFNDLYHSFLESAIHNINNASSIVNASEQIGTPFSWWSRLREVQGAYNNTLKNSSSADAFETTSQPPTTTDHGFMEGVIHKVNDASSIVNGSDSTWRRWMSKLRGYKNMLKGSLTLNGPTSETNQSSFVRTVHNSEDGSGVVESMEQSKGESSWFSKFWSTKTGHDNSTSNVNGTQTADVVADVLETNGHNKSFTTESSVGSTYISTNETSTGSNATSGDVAGSQSIEFNQNSTASIGKPNNTEVDDESSTVKIIFTKPKAEWMSLLADIQAAQGGSVPTVNGTKQQADVRSEGKANATSATPRMYSHFHGSDFEVWSGENLN